MSHRDRSDGGGGLSLGTLIAASLASAVAAVVTSLFWESGTVPSAAITPLLVALLGEAFKRPTQKIGSTVSRRAARPARPLPEAAGAGRPVDVPGRRLDPDPLPGGGVFELPEERVVPHQAGAGRTDEYGDIKVYRRGPNPVQRHWRAALVTGLLAFGIAAAVLTLPELLFGDSVGGGGKTTIFGGKPSGKRDSERDKEKEKPEEAKKSTTEKTDTGPQGQQTAPEPVPDQKQQPESSQPRGGAPAPEQPAPAAPPADGSGAPPAPQQPATP